MTGGEAAIAGLLGGAGAMVGNLFWLGLQKAVLEPVARRLFRRKATRVIPHLARLLEDLDRLMPQQITRLDAAGLERWALGRLEALTGEPWPDPAELEPLWKIYDPRINASKETAPVLHSLQRGAAPAGGR